MYFRSLQVLRGLWERDHPRIGRSPSLFHHLGDYSYAIYLVHVAVMVFLLSLLQVHLARPLDNGIGIGIPATCLVAGWCFGWFDVALHTYLRRLYDARFLRNGPARTIIPVNQKVTPHQSQT